MKKISVEQLIAVIGKKEADSKFLDKDWIRKNRFGTFFVSPFQDYNIFFRVYARTKDNGEGDFKGDIDLSDLGLTKLNLPEEIRYVNGSFNISNNRLTSLEGCPDKVEHNFVCHRNLLTNLIGGPKVVEGDYECQRNKLTSLEGSPRFVFDFSCYDNSLENLDGISPNIKYVFDCNNNPLEDNFKVVRTEDKKTYRLEPR